MVKYVGTMVLQVRLIFILLDLLFRILNNNSSFSHTLLVLLALVVQTLDSAIHRINHYPADSVIDFRNTYPLDSDLSGG